eukprot:CAMPEP_0176002174 /NCGR_PEP_ID=MMETSP0120_2-20121206/510_1 /TAXON_ID=160619 /ORGANISM="Kryptoperidinium foliaceum, Strain CCMP 1326" /LENGTH=277 /DNA_ID=CAMNT_0017334753 /DNA_START=185 /DNA_END=1016 /DNA_ORIENTATION=+
MATKHRIELFFKNSSDLRERVKFLRSNGFNAFNLVNKNQKDNIHEWVNCIQDELGSDDVDICAHYSLKYNKVPRKGIQEHSQLLKEFFDTTTADEILFVSGSGKKAPWNTLCALEAVGDHPNKKVAVAYNPYFPDQADQDKEDERLQQKINSNAVEKVYLQFGTDLVRLQKSLEMLDRKGVALAGSLFLPTAKLISQQKFRPWNGVFLSPEFLSGPDNAESIVLEMMKLYKKHDVEMLWEAPGIRNEKDLKIVTDLISKLERQDIVATKASSAEISE